MVSHVILQSFENWTIDFVGPINPPTKRIGARYIIIVTDYLTRLEKAQLIRDCSTTSVKFIFEYILTRFGFPGILMSDQGSHFLIILFKS